MRIFLTGGTGFIGGPLAAKLHERGDDVVALVRSPEKAGPLREAGCEIVDGDLSDIDAIRSGIERCDAVIHAAAIYEIGVNRERCETMRETSVGGTEAVPTAALEAGVDRALYGSSVVANGDTHGEVADESFEPDTTDMSCYCETKRRAHQAADGLAERGLPLVTLQPGAVYGPDDHSEIGDLMKRFAKGKLPGLFLPEGATNLVHRDEIVDGIIAALDRGRPGESYVLGGENVVFSDLFESSPACSTSDHPARSRPRCCASSLRSGHWSARRSASRRTCARRFG